jgi:hypothetical protein
MSDSPSILILDRPCDDAIDWVARQISDAGLRVTRTFDLHDARKGHIAIHVDCPCPQHGTQPCDCQMVVLLVYGSDRQPITIVARGYNGQTWFSVVDTPQQRADPRLEADVRRAMVPQSLPPTDLENRPQVT